MKRRILAALWAALLAVGFFVPTGALAQVLPVAPFFANGLTTTVVTAKPLPGTLAWLNCVNPNASVVYVQVFDTTGTVTLGTTPPLVAFGLGASQAVSVPDLWLRFFSGIKLAATTTPTGLTAPTTALVCNLGIQ